jgi:hypothetical protein
MRLVRLVVVSLMAFQGCVPSAKALLNLRRPLTSEELQIVVNGIQQALAGKTLRLVQERGTDDREVLMGTGAMPLKIRLSLSGIGVTAEGEIVAGIFGGIPGGAPVPRPVPTPFVELIEYTSNAARRCDGDPATGEMVVVYLLDVAAHRWTVRARESHPGDRAVLRPLELLTASASLESGETRLVRTRVARAIVSRMSNAGGTILTGDPAPNPAEFVPVQSLWIDTNSLLPLRWEVSQREAIVAAYDFVYERLDFQRPTGVDVPTCVP